MLIYFTINLPTCKRHIQFLDFCKRTLNSSVPQGIIITPILYNLYTNAVCVSVLKSSRVLFADGLKVFHNIRNAEDCKILQFHLDAVQKLDFDKEQNLDEIMFLFVHANIRHFVFKLYCTHIAHVDHAVKQTLKMLWIIRYITCHSFTVDSLIIVHCAIVQSKLVFASFVSASLVVCGF